MGIVAVVHGLVIVEVGQEMVCNALEVRTMVQPSEIGVDVAPTGLGDPVSRVLLHA